MRAPQDKPNIILINCDDLGYGDIGCYGSKQHSTPAIDSLADAGLRFTDFYMAAPVCSPSRAAMMTGCYPGRVGLDVGEDRKWVLFPGDGVGLSCEEVTIASLLREQGYATKIVGKWHLGDQPEFLPMRHGFDSWFGLPYSNDMGIRKPRPDYPPLPLMDDEEVVEEQPDQATLTERYVEHCVRFIRANKDQPFFLYFAHMYVHGPLYTPKRFAHASRNGRYGAAVECIDWSTAAILYELRRLGLEQNTLVVFTSDNGCRPRAGGSNAPLRGEKGTTWEGGMRLPCIMRWPGMIEPGTICRELTTAMDFLPSFAAIAGGSAPEDRVIDGHDVRPLIFGEGGAVTPWDEFFYYRMDELQAVRAGKWKLHLLSGELYDLKGDVGETTDLASKHPDVVSDLQARARRCREDLGDYATGTKGNGRRAPGTVQDPDTLTHADPDCPYMIAMYD